MQDLTLPLPTSIQAGVFCIGYFKYLFSDASNIAGLRELSIAFLFDDNPVVGLGDASI
jgi:hypothetical protein